jgi:di/tricarboxylate transporter
LSLVNRISEALTDEVRRVIRRYMHETEVDFKKRLRKILITGIVISVLSTLVISLMGSASLFILIGSLKYLITIMPEWKAWDIMGLTSLAAGALLSSLLIVIIKRQLKSE